MELRADARPARSFAMRRGQDRQRRIDTRYLWLQEEVAHGRVRISKIRGDSNPADLMTKCLAAADIVHRASLLNADVRVSADGRMGRGRGGVSKCTASTLEHQHVCSTCALGKSKVAPRFVAILAQVIPSAATC